jgi:hypothetical protein
MAPENVMSKPPATSPIGFGGVLFRIATDEAGDLDAAGVGTRVSKHEIEAAAASTKTRAIAYIATAKDPGRTPYQLLKGNVTELGGREFGIARTKTGNFAIVPMGAGIYRVAAIEWDRDAANKILIGGG